MALWQIVAIVCGAHIFMLLVSAYSLCDVSIYPYKQQQVSINVQPSATRSITVNNKSIPVQVSGKIRVVDGCTFQSDLTLTGPATPVYWYGGNLTDKNTAYRLTSLAQPVLSGNITFKFTDRAGESVSYTDFNEFRLFVVDSNEMIATASLPAPDAGFKAANSPSGPSAKKNSAALLVNTALLCLIFQ